jgi:hypothetical protein
MTEPHEIIFAAKPSPPDERDWPLSAIYRLPEGLTLPDRARVKGIPSPPYDQDGTPRCVTYSGAGNATIAEDPEAGGQVRFNADELYARCKEKDGDPTGDGTYIRVAADIRLKRGMFATTGRVAGELLKIGSYAKLALTYLDFETAIYAASDQANPRVGGAPWVAGNWPANWFNVPANELLPPPVFAASAQGHAFDIIEYWRSHPAGRCFKILNSWGSDFGEHGEAWVRYDDLMAVLWEGWKTTDAPDPAPPAPVSYGDFTVSKVGTATLNAAPSTMQVISVRTGHGRNPVSTTYPAVDGGTKTFAWLGAEGLNQHVYLVSDRGEPCWLLARNCTFA